MEHTLPSLREVYRIGRGPSSSHTMGPDRAARLFRARHPECRSFRVVLYGSLAATGLGHLTDDAVTAALEPAACEVTREPDRKTRHPNALRFDALDDSGTVLDSWWAYSVGGGALEDDDGPILDSEPVRYPVRCMDEALAWSRKNNKPFWALAQEVEPDAWPHLKAVWRAMTAAVEAGLASEECILPGGLGVPRKAESAHTRASSLTGVHRDLSLIAAYALAVSEENAAGHTVVTAPTCGAAGVMPAILTWFVRARRADERAILRALATAGLFGGSTALNASISGAQVGCQGEVGTACSMAAAAAAQLLGGSAAHIEYAAEMGMEHHLGLTCDPVAGLVQIPCIERNALGAVRALDCATFALLGDGSHLISFDEVVEVMAETGRDLQSAYKETAVGGLAEIWLRKKQRVKGR